MLKEFLVNVLPSSGMYCMTIIDRAEPDELKKAKNYFAKDIQGLMHIKKTYENNPFDFYFAVSSFTSAENRRATNVLRTRSFFLDLDVGDNPKKYPDKPTALSALKILDELPPPIVVDSGTGIHAYWVFDEDIPVNIWKAYAIKFKSYCLNKLKIDPTVTADPARIMRLPETFNHKTAPPNPSKILSDKLYIYDFDNFKDFLGPIDDSIDKILSQVPKGLDDDTKDLIRRSGNFESVFKTIAQRSLANSGCAQLRKCILESATLPEPLWHAALSIAQRCTDRDTAIHLLSEDYPKYNRELTEAKANATKGPYSCEGFENLNPGGCTGCEFRGKITNPLALGRQIISNTLPAVATWTAPTNPVAFPADIMPFMRGQNGGIYYLPPFETDDKGNKIQDPPTLISEHDIYPVRRIFNPHDGEVLVMNYIMPNDGTRVFNIPTKSLNKLSDLFEIVGAQGLNFSNKTGTLFMEYLIKWGRYLINKNKADQMRMQMGWTEDLQGFVVGEREIRSNGDIVNTAASPLIHTIAKLVCTQGDYTKWKIAAKKLNLPTMELHAFVLLCGFGSPLMRLTTTAGVSVGLVGETGWGKTGALYSCLSIFGDPANLSLAGAKGQTATENAMRQWMLGHKNLVFSIDEISNYKPEDLSNLLYSISQGKSKLRLQGSANGFREIEQICSLIAIFTSNQAGYDKLTTLKTTPDGELARFVEIQTGSKPMAMETNKNLGKEIFDTFRLNYGFAGIEYIKGLYKLGDLKILELIYKWIFKFHSKFGQDSANRFYENLIGTCFAGGEIANDLGIIDLDLNRIFDEVVTKISVLKQTLQQSYMDPSVLLGEFYNRYLPNTLFIEHGHVIKEPKGSLMLRVDLTNKEAWISSKHLRNYIMEGQGNLKQFIHHLTQTGVCLRRDKKRLAEGWSNMNPNSVNVFVFKYDSGTP